MSTSIVRLFGNLGRLLLLAAFTLVLTMGIGQTARAVSTGPAPVNLGTAGACQFGGRECEKIGYREKGDSHEGEQSGQASRNGIESRAGD